MCLTEYNETETMEMLRQEGRQEGRQETKLLDIRNLMDSTGWNAEQAMDMLKIPTNQRARACLKNHSYHLHAPLCVIFAPNSGCIAHYAPFIWHKSPTNCDAHLAESIFQTRSSLYVNLSKKV